MSQYPVIMIPIPIEKVKSSLPPKPVLTVNPPEEVGATPQKINQTLIVVETAVAIPTIPLTSQLTHIPGWLLFLAATGAIVGHTWQQIKSYPQRLNNHREKVKNYEIEIEKYEDKVRQHEEEVKASRTPEKVSEFQYKLLSQVLKQTIPHDNTGSDAPTGKWEGRFEKNLKRYFSDKIKIRLKVQNPKYNEGYYYTPDFTYIDSDLKLYIDIEIDEPYIKSNGEPIHYVGLDKQRKRDEHFNERQWIIIRFSEEQVAKWPNSCCKTIATIISEITKNTSILNQFSNIPDLQPVKRWTQDEAIQMALMKSRDKY